MNNPAEPTSLSRLNRSLIHFWLFLLMLSAATALVLVYKLMLPLSSASGRIELRPALPAASAFENKKRPLVIAIIDTGMDLDHPELQGLLWNNAGEGGQEAHGFDKVTRISDEGQGLVDDLHGWNFADSNSDLTDQHGHGTHIAGIIHHELLKYHDPQNDRPVRFMILKYYAEGRSGAENLRNSNAALDYAIEHGAEIINYSGGGRDASFAERSLMEKARDLGVLMVAAAGNEAVNTDRTPFYPASYGLENIISVANATDSGEVARTSNFGPKSVDIAAPGERILSTTPGGREAIMTGTSQATAFVTAALAAYLASRPDSDMDFADIREHLFATAAVKSSMQALLRSGGELATAALIASRSSATTASDFRQLNDLADSAFLIPAPRSDVGATSESASRLGLETLNVQ